RRHGRPRRTGGWHGVAPDIRARQRARARGLHRAGPDRSRARRRPGAPRPRATRSHVFVGCDRGPDGRRLPRRAGPLTTLAAAVDRGRSGTRELGLAGAVLEEAADADLAVVRPERLDE